MIFETLLEIKTEFESMFALLLEIDTEFVFIFETLFAINTEFESIFALFAEIATEFVAILLDNVLMFYLSTAILSEFELIEVLVSKIN